MKKVLLFCVAAAALVLSASCNKGGNGAVVLPAAKYSAEAQKLVLDMTSDKNPGIHSIEFTESGRYLICWKETKAVVEETVRYESGTYTVNNGEYILKNASGKAAGTVTVSGNQVTITLNGENIGALPIESVADKYPENEFYTTIARAWNVDKTDISVKFDGQTSVAVTYDGCDIPAILKELEKKAQVDLKDEDFKGYVVSEMNFTMSKTIEVSFTGKDSVAGPISISEDGSVSYTLSGSNGVEVLSGSATGKFDLNPGLGSNQIMLTLNTELTTKSGKTYQGHVSFVLSPKA